MQSSIPIVVTIEFSVREFKELKTNRHSFRIKPYAEIKNKLLDCELCERNVGLHERSGGEESINIIGIGMS